MTGRWKKTAGERHGRGKGAIEEAILGVCGESEQTVGFYTMLEDNLGLPFQTEVLGLDVTVERIDMTDDGQIVAICSRGKSLRSG